MSRQLVRIFVNNRSIFSQRAGAVRGFSSENQGSKMRNRIFLICFSIIGGGSAGYLMNRFFQYEKTHEYSLIGEPPSIVPSFYPCNISSFSNVKAQELIVDKSERQLFSSCPSDPRLGTMLVKYITSYIKCSDLMIENNLRLLAIENLVSGVKKTLNSESFQNRLKEYHHIGVEDHITVINHNLDVRKMTIAELLDTHTELISFLSTDSVLRDDPGTEQLCSDLQSSLTNLEIDTHEEDTKLKLSKTVSRK
jgi:hypothetical protein